MPPRVHDGVKGRRRSHVRIERLQAMNGRMRLDAALLARGLVASRSRARDLILRGEVSVDGQPAGKPGELVGPGQAIAVPEESARIVSRAGEKLAHALSHFGFPVAGRVALDVGASTGGFTEALLAAGAAKVYAVDVGRGQLHPRLVADSRVVSLEGTDARELSRALVPEPAAAIVADVSFISLSKALPAALALAAPEAWLIALVKPQFESGREAVGKGGIVHDEAARGAAVAKVETFLADSGWRVAGIIASPLPGKDGNREFLIGAQQRG